MSKFKLPLNLSLDVWLTTHLSIILLFIIIILIITDDNNDGDGDNGAGEMSQEIVGQFVTCLASERCHRRYNIVYYIIHLYL